MEPYEIVAGPLTLWLAPVGTAFPLIGVAPPNPWTKVGASGTRNYSEDGVALSHSETLQKARPAGSMGARKVFRQEEDMTITVTLWDNTLEAYTLALGGLAPGTTAAGPGTAGFKKIGLSRGETVKTYALLARGAGLSAYGDGLAAQYEVPRCYQSGNANPVYKKGLPVALQLVFDALEHDAAASDDERFGRLIMQHQAPLAP
jgi:hypothetical protein